jgi:hypothetical protein
MPGWTTAHVNGVWRMENPDYRGHRLTVYRSKAPGAYRAYLDGRLLGSLEEQRGCHRSGGESCVRAQHRRPPRRAALETEA